MPWSTTEISTSVAVRLGGDQHRRAVAGVGDGVGDQVADRGGDLLAVAEDLEPGLAAGDHGDPLRARRRSRWCRRPSPARRRARPPRGVSSGSSPWSRDSSMICWTSRVSRSLSVSIRPANRLTASGSSAASVTASASSRIAPTGVFSSWLTLATKSRRTASTRRSRVRSSTSASTSREPSGATRAVTWRDGRLLRDMSSSVSRICPSRRTCRTSVGELLGDQRVAAHQPERVRRRGGLEHHVVRRRRRPRCCAGRTAPRPRRAARGAPRRGARACCWRSLMCQASTAPPATTAPMSAARNACVVGSTADSIVRHLGRSPAVSPWTAGLRMFTASFTLVALGRHLGLPRVRAMREAFHDQLDADLRRPCRHLPDRSRPPSAAPPRPCSPATPRSPSR